MNVRPSESVRACVIQRELCIIHTSGECVANESHQEMERERKSFVKHIEMFQDAAPRKTTTFLVFTSIYHLCRFFPFRFGSFRLASFACLFAVIVSFSFDSHYAVGELLTHS